MTHEMYSSREDPNDNFLNSESANEAEYKIGENYARTIIKNNDFGEASRILAEEDLLTPEVLRTKEEYANELENADFMTSRDWELLTMIDLYSPELAVHCIETYEIVRSRIDQIHIGSETIAEAISGEVSMDEFYRACLLHDIGKTLIPEAILNNTLEPGEWETTISANQVFPEEDINELERRGISADRTFREIIELHELASKQLLEDEGLSIEGEIAGQHHNYRHAEYQYPTSSQTIGIGANLSDLLHLADEEQALMSKRSYKPSFSHTTVLDILVQDAEKGAINKELTALWVQNELTEDDPTSNTPDDDQKRQHIYSFIEQYRPKA